MVSFDNPKQIVMELTDLQQFTCQFDQEYYDSRPIPAAGSPADAKEIMKIFERHVDRSGSMEYFALHRSFSAKEAVTRIGDAILVRGGMWRVIDLLKDVLTALNKLENKASMHYYEYFIQRWVYKFCRLLFQESAPEEQLKTMFEKEIKKEREGFKDLLVLIQHFSAEAEEPEAFPSYDPDNFRRLYVVFARLILVYFKSGVSIPINLQKIFKEFQEHAKLPHALYEEESEALQQEKAWLLAPPDNLKKFFAEYKLINSPMKKAVFLGLMLTAERHLIIRQLCKVAIKTVADMYTFLGKNISKAGDNITLGKEWLIAVYSTITEVVAELKIIEDQSVDEKIRKVFGTPIKLPSKAQPAPKPAAQPQPASEPEAEEDDGIFADPVDDLFDEEPDASEPEAATPTPPPKTQEGPKLIEIPNLVTANSLDELKDTGQAKNIVIVQDANILDLVVQNWELRGSVTFPEMVEFVRIPLHVRQTKSPGIREGRRIISFAYLIAMDMPQDMVNLMIDKFAQLNQITPTRAEQLKKLYPNLMQELGDIKQLNRDARKMMNNFGMILANIFHEKCVDLRTSFMENYSYLESLITYWMLVEELYHGVAKATALMGNIKDPTPKEIERFATQKNDEYFNAYEKALAFPEYRHLRSYFKKKYNPELTKHFVNVKIKNDLISMSQVTPLDLGERFEVEEG